MAWELPTDLVNDSQGLMEGTARWAYRVTGGWWWTLMLMGFCIVLYWVASVHKDDKAFGYAAITGLFGATILVTLNLMPWWIASIFIIAGAFGIAGMILNRPPK